LYSFRHFSQFLAVNHKLVNPNERKPAPLMSCVVWLKSDLEIPELSNAAPIARRARASERPKMRIRSPYPEHSERRILILAGSLPGKNLHIGQHSQNRWGICFLHVYAAAASGIRAGLYGTLDYSYLATAVDILAPVNLALTHLHGSPGNVGHAISECSTQPDLLHLNPASKIGDVDLFVFLIGVASRALAQFLAWICFK
jgi:hypothetical protein